MGAHQQRAGRIRRHRQQNALVVVDDRRARADPVGSAHVAQVLRIGCNAIERGEFVVGALADRGGHAGVEVEGVPRVATTETVCAGTTLPVLGAAG